MTADKHDNHAGGLNTSQRGFTLIEMLIVLAIIGVIAGVAYPTYTHYVERSLRSDAQAGLLLAASELERCYSRQYSYANCAITPTSPDGNYTITATEKSDTHGGFLLSARTLRSDGCAGDIKLNALGEKLPEACW